MCDILKWCKKSDDVPAIQKLRNITKHPRASVILSRCLCHSCCLECPSLPSGKSLLSSNSHVRFYRLSDNLPNSPYHSRGCPLLLCRTLITLLLDTYHSAVTSVYMSVSPVKSRALLPTHSNQELHHRIFCAVSLCMLFDAEEVLMSGWRHGLAKLLWLCWSRRILRSYSVLILKDKEMKELTWHVQGHIPTVHISWLPFHSVQYHILGNDFEKITLSTKQKLITSPFQTRHTWLKRRKSQKRRDKEEAKL